VFLFLTNLCVGILEDAPFREVYRSRYWGKRRGREEITLEKKVK
jgi:hypothetical protein